MIQKRMPLLVVLSTCLIATSNAMEEGKAAEKSITVDETFLSQHHESFQAFVTRMGVQKKAVDVISPAAAKAFIQGASWITSWLSGSEPEFAGYVDELDGLAYLNRFFADETQRTKALGDLQTDTDFQAQASDHLSNVFDALARESEKGRKSFCVLLHAQNMKTLKQRENTTRKEIAELANKRSEGGSPTIISDEKYFRATTLSLLTLHVYEERQKRQSGK